jgi:hypothetical protein
MKPLNYILCSCRNAWAPFTAYFDKTLMESSHGDPRDHRPINVLVRLSCNACMYLQHFIPHVLTFISGIHSNLHWFRHAVRYYHDILPVQDILWYEVFEWEVRWLLDLHALQATDCQTFVHVILSERTRFSKSLSILLSDVAFSSPWHRWRLSLSILFNQPGCIGHLFTFAPVGYMWLLWVSPTSKELKHAYIISLLKVAMWVFFLHFFLCSYYFLPGWMAERTWNETTTVAFNVYLPPQASNSEDSRLNLRWLNQLSQSHRWSTSRPVTPVSIQMFRALCKRISKSWHGPIPS